MAPDLIGNARNEQRPGANQGAAECQPGGDTTHHTTISAKSSLARWLERIPTADRRWFERHPKLRCHIRPPLPGEVPAGEWMAVRNFGDVRARIPLFGEIPPGLTDRGIDWLMVGILPSETARMLDEIAAVMRECGK